MATSRRGGFGASLRPFGGGASSFAQYDIGATLAEMEATLVEVRWRNGEATDEEFLVVLRKALDAATPDSQAWIRAKDRLDDNVYRIGRSVAEELGLDELIAFDQGAIAKMNPESVRYRDVKQSLDSELASRRSRDYGRLVDEYNEGTTSTKSLLDWVTGTVASLDPEARDFENWTGVASDLTERVATERDSKMYQDYQQGRMKPAAFLSYLTTRRDEFDPGSPKREDWDRRLEDATEQVKNTAQSAADQAFFAKYEEGKVSDTTYLKYLRTRIGGMDEDDPQKGEWQHRLHQAAFSLAEDQLRFDVEKGKAPVGRLISFYSDYRRGLNPGSAEYRQITRSLDVLARSGLGGGGRGSGSGGGGGGSAKGSAGAAVGVGKLISGPYTLDNILPLLTINPLGSKKDVAAAKKAYDTNYQSLTNARTAGDEKWLFFDPRKPGATTAAMNPDGSPVLGKDGRPVIIRGSAYLDVEDQTLATFDYLKADFHYKVAEIALAHHDSGGYFVNLKFAIEAQDKGRRVESQAVERSNKQFFDAASEGIDLAIKISDYATAYNLGFEVAARLDGELKNPMLDDTRRDRLEGLAAKLDNNQLFAVKDPITGEQSGGAIDLARSTKDAQGNYTNVVLLPGWHHVLDQTDAKGQADWGLAFDDRQDGSWEAARTKVYTTYGSLVVQGEVKVGSAPTDPSVTVQTDAGVLDVPGAEAAFFSYVDEHGQLVRAYSLDGVSWIRAMPGMGVPRVTVEGVLTPGLNDKGANVLNDAQGKVVFTEGAGGWEQNKAYFQENPGANSWFGQREYEAKADRARGLSVKTLGWTIGGASRPDTVRNLKDDLYLERERVRGVEVGAPGSHMLLAPTGPDGTVNMLPSALDVPLVTEREYRGLGKILSDLTGIKPQRAGGGLSPAERPSRMNVSGSPDERDALARLRAQLPADTPTRYEGSSFVPVALPALIKSIPVLGQLAQAASALPPLMAALPPLTMADRTKDDLYVAPKKPPALGKRPPPKAAPPPAAGVLRRSAPKPPKAGGKKQMLR